MPSLGLLAKTSPGWAAISPPLVGRSTDPVTNQMYPVPEPVVSPWACPLPSQKYPIPFVSSSLYCLAWLGLASLASAWLVWSAAATTTATTTEQAYKMTVAARDSQMEVDIQL